MQLSVTQMQKALEALDMDLPDAPARWGDMRQHMFWGALYHWFVFAGGRDYPAAPTTARSRAQDFQHGTPPAGGTIYLCAAFIVLVMTLNLRGMKIWE